MSKAIVPTKTFHWKILGLIISGAFSVKLRVYLLQCNPLSNVSAIFSIYAFITLLLGEHKHPDWAHSLILFKLPGCNRSSRRRIIQGQPNLTVLLCKWQLPSAQIGQIYKHTCCKHLKRDLETQREHLMQWGALHNNQEKPFPWKIPQGVQTTWDVTL